MDFETVLANALHLSAAERARLADRLLASLKESTELSGQEPQRRLDAFRAGRARSLEAASEE